MGTFLLVQRSGGGDKSPEELKAAVEGGGSADLQEMYKVREGIGHGSWWAPSKCS